MGDGQPRTRERIVLFDLLQVDSSVVKHSNVVPRSSRLVASLMLCDTLRQCLFFSEIIYMFCHTVGQSPYQKKIFRLFLPYHHRRPNSVCSFI